MEYKARSMTDRKKPGVAFWASVVLAVALGAPVVYLSAYGPWIFVAKMALGWTAEDASIGFFEGANSFARTAEPYSMATLADPYAEYLRFWIHESDGAFP